ncbi:1-(5-phosphoribosyl)-5-[(5-phosphoribosylamino)methylideneamino] imidazole-4-carboxamide isomerase [Desulfonauticus submarinus]|uniref:1-(5-phosphoribosyl)-5-[(5-phosphoribosylamino)methylideneamino] imidazole-4-carboxamide isomerase n=1 Tax=Desulfonauticus submarinus TaxID=206665 RepID=A0A1H0AAB5_9BACT|nr:1-(5-phosphoribosyl)-5-[(5-phosphoribosylamino)methylideneamino]imidazole-4-carboxamide isomerase [Desulfonauticus submarinus]SDN29883.1 1-(5-phosphoribosyl)-5-[(5-phosphoribosylamino)methylideneamino] imidazole-4-carboxamide isomerase [Desulfonauticus submarinus]
MIIFPAIDIKGGKCVRLKQGEADKQTTYFEDPVEAAVFWQNQGAKWLHVIDLDGAFEGEPKNLKLIEKICTKVSIPVQLGGGIRSLTVAKYYLEAGVERLIIGTMALQSPHLFEKLVESFKQKIGVSLDAKNGYLKIKGWVEDINKTIYDVIPWLNKIKTGFIVYTDISRDGMQKGVNLQALEEVLKLSNMPVLIAGGVSNLDDIKKLYPFTKLGLEGVITGRAIYEKTLNLQEALNWIAAQS